MVEILKNQIALAMFVFMMIVAGSFWVLDGATAKDVIIQVITAVCALVTGQQMEKSKAQRAFDKVDELQAEAKVEAVKVEIEKAKTEVKPVEREEIL